LFFSIKKQAKLSVFEKKNLHCRSPPSPDITDENLLKLIPETNSNPFSQGSLNGLFPSLSQKRGKQKG
jgi:hypothetical protein